MILQKPSIQSRRDRLVFIVGLLAIVVMAALLAATPGLSDSLTLDEPFTADKVNYTIPRMLSLLWDDIQQPFYYVALRPWRVVFGESELALRAPSLILFSGTIVLTALAGRAIYGSMGGLVAGGLVALSNLGLRYAVTARPYVLVGFLVALYLLIVITWMRKRHDSDWLTARDGVFILILGFIGALGMLTHIVFVFILAAFTFGSLVLSRRHAFRFGLASVVAGILFLLIWGSYFIHSLTLQSQNAFYQAPRFGDLLAGYSSIFGLNKSLVLLVLLLLLVVVQWRAVLTFLKQRSNLFLGLVMVLAVLLPFIFSLVRPVFVAGRTPIIGLPVAAVLLGGLFALFERRWLVVAPIVALGLASSYVSLDQWLNSDRTQFADQVAYVLSESACGDMIISVGLTEGEVTYYLRRLDATACLVHAAFPVNDQGATWASSYTSYAEAQRTELETEASSLIAQAVDQDVQRLWIFAPTRYRNAVPAEILRAEAARQFMLKDEMQGYGTFNDVVLRYERVD